MKLNTNTIILAIAALAVAAAAYWYFFTGTGNEPPLSVTAENSEVQARFEALVSQLQPITFNTGIFSDSRFAALVDLATPVAPETIGRLDPFAPVPGISGK